jgi:hypothetical protein
MPALIAASGEHASLRLLEFFAANIRNSHTRRAYGSAVVDHRSRNNKERRHRRITQPKKARRA